MRQDELVEAYVVQARPWRETSLLYKLIARHHGWVSVVHRGARKSRRDRPLPTLTPVQVSWSGRGSLQTLRRSEAGGALAVRDPERQVLALYVNELITYLVPDDRRSDEIYPLYHAALRQLGTAADPEWALRGIELDLLQLAGHPLPLDHTEHGPVARGRQYRYCPGTGPEELPEGAREAGVSGATLLALQHREALSDPQRREARRLMRQVLDYYTAPRIIRSRTIMRALGTSSTSRRSRVPHG